MSDLDTAAALAEITEVGPLAVPTETPDAPWVEPAKDLCRLPQAETPEQRRERLAEAILLKWHSPQVGSGEIADAVIASDRAAGDDPEALRALIDLEQREKRALQRERDEARAEVERLKAGIRQLGPIIDAADTVLSDSDHLRAALTASVAREAVLRETLRKIKRMSSDDASELEAAKDWAVDHALATPSPAAEAMVRVVEAADHWDRVRGSDPVTRADVGDALIDAVRAHRITTGRDALTGEVK
ncbi:hypothetical protein [Magnetospirillum fulvum]|uniref:Uncharacterized protein n=1 Tax=Magnetospirillum fulvum MGU-K5 TaxID=1316936 RepID=S9TMM8_MAGFU|nr:hypothetical protein [Magnetospirillum fulvum]EPY03531.1 hypothetical protein K678_00430 [Magnetospirillum fulvum MGU-K5]